MIYVMLPVCLQVTEDCDMQTDCFSSVAVAVSILHC